MSFTKEQQEQLDEILRITEFDDMESDPVLPETPPVPKYQKRTPTSPNHSPDRGIIDCFRGVHAWNDNWKCECCGISEYDHCLIKGGA